MIERLSENDLEFMESFHNPVCMVECLFSDLDNLTQMVEDKYAHMRLGQYPLLSYEYLIDSEIPELSPKQNFTLRKNAGEIYCLGGRLFGKTLIVEKADVLVSMAILDIERVGFSSYDAIHIRGVLEDIVNAVEQHPFYKMLGPSVNRSPSYRIQLKTGYLLEGINMNLNSKSPGNQFYQKHLTRLYIEEASMETEQIFKIRRDSVSEIGCIFRIAGMTNFTKYSPCGQVFYDMSQRSKMCNLPQYVNPRWDEKSKLQAIKDFGGEQSIGYRVFIRGEIVEDGVSTFDMERVRKNYVETRQTKNFEISKENFGNFESHIVVERPKNADCCFVFADIGESAPTEIGIVFEVNKVYKYVYNVTLYNLTDKEQFKVFKWLGLQLKANFIALDCTDGTGRAIFRSLAEVFPSENLVAVSLNEKIPVDFEKDESGNIVTKSGQPVYKEEYVAEWSVKHLKDLLYSERMELPVDYKFDSQINSVVSMQSGTRTIYQCVSQDDHLFQAFQIFAILQWNVEFLLLKPVKVKDFYKGGV